MRETGKSVDSPRSNRGPNICTHLLSSRANLRYRYIDTRDRCEPQAGRQAGGQAGRQAGGQAGRQASRRMDGRSVCRHAYIMRHIALYALNASQITVVDFINANYRRIMFTRFSLSLPLFCPSVLSLLLTLTLFFLSRGFSSTLFLSCMILE